MHGSAQELESYKRELILQYLIPAFGSLVTFYEQKIEDIVSCSLLQKMVRNQYMESPGPGLTGFLWFSIEAMCHSYFFNSQKNMLCGTNIYKKRALIFNGDSLINGLDRQDYVQILEDGFVLSISFPDVLQLMNKYKDLDQAMRLFTHAQGMYFRQQGVLREIPSLERVRRLRTEHAAFVSCATKEVQAIHAHLSVKQYYNKIKQLETESR